MRKYKFSFIVLITLAHIQPALSYNYFKQLLFNYESSHQSNPAECPSTQTDQITGLCLSTGKTLDQQLNGQLHSLVKNEIDPIADLVLSYNLSDTIKKQNKTQLDKLSSFTVQQEKTLKMSLIQLAQIEYKIKTINENFYKEQTNCDYLISKKWRRCEKLLANYLKKNNVDALLANKTQLLIANRLLNYPGYTNWIEDTIKDFSQNSTQNTKQEFVKRLTATQWKKVFDKNISTAKNSLKKSISKHNHAPPMLGKLVLCL